MVQSLLEPRHCIGKECRNRRLLVYRALSQASQVTAPGVEMKPASREAQGPVEEGKFLNKTRTEEVE